MNTSNFFSTPLVAVFLLAACSSKDSSENSSLQPSAQVDPTAQTPEGPAANPEPETGVPGPENSTPGATVTPSSPSPLSPVGPGPNPAAAGGGPAVGGERGDLPGVAGGTSEGGASGAPVTASGGSGAEAGSGGELGTAGASPQPVGGAGGDGAAGAAGSGGMSQGSAGTSSVDPGLGPREPDTGPGAPTETFGDGDLFQVCAYVDGGDTDQDHHNTVAMYDGYMVMPWAHEAGGGGISFYDISDPCSPQRIGLGTSAEMRETHTVSISNLGGRWLFAAQKETGSGAGGLQVWDISDVTSPSVVTKMPIAGHSYPNAYDYVTMATAPQGQYLYVAAGFLGFFVVDISDPTSPEIVGEYQTNPPLRTQEVIVVGNLLFSSAAEGARVVLLDISNPTAPAPIPGGDFNLQAGGGQVNAYSGNVNGGYAYFARQSGAGGVVVYDITNPGNPTFAGDYNDSGGNGGYVFFHDSHLFVGNSNFFTVYDASDLGGIQPVDRLTLPGDQDTITPIGNIALLSVDASATGNQASAIAPWSTTADETAPAVNWVYPASGSTGIARSSRIGVTFTEGVTYQSAWRPGAVRMYPTALGPDASIEAVISVMDTVVNLVPSEPLAAATEYTFEVLAGGVEDNVGNAVTETFTATFTTGG